LLEPEGQPVAIGTILNPPRPVDQSPSDSLEPEFEEWPIVDFEQPIGDMNSVIGIDADQMGDFPMKPISMIYTVSITSRFDRLRDKKLAILLTAKEWFQPSPYHPY